jgi:hypothetical protein
MPLAQGEYEDVSQAPEAQGAPEKDGALLLTDAVNAENFFV